MFHIFIVQCNVAQNKIIKAIDQIIQFKIQKEELKEVNSLYRTKTFEPEVQVWELLFVGK